MYFLFLLIPTIYNRCDREEAGNSKSGELLLVTERQYLLILDIYTSAEKLEF